MQLPEEVVALQKMVRDFVNKEVIPKAADYEKRGEYPKELDMMAFDMGLPVLCLPTQYGGGGMSELALTVVMEELARGDLGFANYVSASTLATLPILIAGTEEQKKQWTELLLETKYAAFALTEPEAGSDAAGAKTTATKDGNDYIINGRKCFITNGSNAGEYLVMASIDRSKGIKGLTCFIVERSRPGISIGKEEDKMGIRNSNTADVIFDNVRIPAANRVGEEGKGFGIIMKTLDASRPSVGAHGVGVAQRALEEAIKYAKQRIQFGKPIAAIPAVQIMVADMAIKIETARQMIYHACDLYDRGLPHTIESCIAKTVGAEAGWEAVDLALQIHGGYGYMREYPIEKLYRDVRIVKIYEGTNQIQRGIIGGSLLR
ncbi:MAG: acyl-CoA dehydrogenase family protein [Acidaminococcales bacterium]|jgi:butyryl-CoA dehydrogenase|nr:acyl-CoA dehydrogenase family protein [Acidaminococcales bacterium]